MVRIKGRIRAIIFGTIPDKPHEYWTVAVGSRQNWVEKGENKGVFYISAIEEDEGSLFDLGYMEYNVYLSKSGTREDEFLWKKYTSKPDIIQYYFEGEQWV